MKKTILYYQDSFLNLMNTLQVILHVQANLLPQYLSNVGPGLMSG